MHDILGKMVAVPVQYYELLASVALDKLTELETAEQAGCPVPLVESIAYGELIRWKAWHTEAERLGLTGLE